MSHIIGYQTSVQTRRGADTSPRDPQSRDPFNPFSSRFKLSEEEREFVAVGLAYASPLLSAIWPWSAKIASPFTAWIADYGLSALENRISQRLQAEIDEDEESDLINDLHSIQLTRRRIRSPLLHPFTG
jgi:hypothetical protein